MDKVTKRIAIGSFIAGLVGFVAGILTAPKSGKETRSDIRSASDVGIAEAERQLKRLHTELNQLLGELNKTEGKTKQAVTDFAKQKRVVALKAELVDKASQARQKAREMLSLLHDGQADDRELDKAVNEATKAIKSIRLYLQK